MSSSLSDLLARHVGAGTMPGAIASFGVDLEPIAVGTVAPGGPPMPVDAIVRIQSMTKVMTATAALRLVQDGALALDDPVATWLPELASPLALPHPDAPLAEARPARSPITVRHLLTNRSGYGAMTSDSPLHRAMRDAGVDAGPDPVDRDAADWLAALASLPLAFEPGEGWRYHHSFGVLGILLGRVAGRSSEHVLADAVLGPAGMRDTGFTVPEAQLHRLLPAFRREGEGFALAEPAGGGMSAAPAPFDVSHGELVSTLADVHAFLTALLGGRLVDAPLVDELRSDQVPDAVKTDDSFFPGFWTGTGWGYGVSVVTEGPHRGRFGWSGGLGTDFLVDPDGTIGIVFTQVELDDRLFAMLGELQDVTRA